MMARAPSELNNYFKYLRRKRAEGNSDGAKCVSVTCDVAKEQARFLFLAESERNSDVVNKVLIA